MTGTSADDDPVGVGLRLLRRNPYGFLTTVRGAVPHTRLVQHLAVDEDGTVWIGTSPRSRKVAEIASNPGVSYAVEDRRDVSYLVVQATATIVADEAVRVAKWQSDLAVFFPGGPRGDDFVLIRLRSMRWELMDFAHHLHPDPYGLVPTVVERSGQGWVEVAAERGS